MIQLWLGTLCALVILCSAANADTAARPSWNFLQRLDDSTAKVSFQVDSTWVLVHGTTKGLDGTISRGGHAGELIVVEASLPVQNFDTGNESRDEHLREVMHAAVYPLVTLKVTLPAQRCSPDQIPPIGQCQSQADGALTIRDKTLPVSFPVLLERKNGNVEAVASLTLRWADYGVEDPSIFIAKFDEEVRVDILARLRE